MTEQADLAERLLENDERVLEEILNTFGPVILVVMNRRYHGVLPETDIEDALSISLYRLWNHRSRYDVTKASLKVWFFRIVENAIRDVLRHGWHKARALETTSDAALTGVADSPREPPPSDLAPTNLQLDLREIVAALPETQRLIVMADAATPDGPANSQSLAKEMKIPSSTVRVYRKRAMDFIRKQLSSRGHDVPQQ